MLLADSCGLGKTLSAVCATLRMRSPTSPNWRVLVVCPLRIRDQWVEEIFDQDPFTPVTILESGLPLNFQAHQPVPVGWFIIHYEIVTRMLKELNRYVWDVVIADEAHRLKNRQTGWTRSIKRITAARKLALTGTPMERTPADLWSIGNWLYPKVFTSYWKFYYHYVDLIVDSVTGMEKPKGIKNEEQLAALLARFVLRRTKEEVVPELPPRIVTKVPIQMDARQAALYTKVENAGDIVVEIEGRKDPLVIANTLTQIVRLQQISSLPALLGSPESSAKIEWVLDWLKDNPDIPVVIFSKFRGVISHLSGLLGEPHQIIVGGVQAQPPRDGRITLGTIAAMGEGLNLQWASVAIFVDEEWSTIKMTQAYDRIHRMGISEPKQIYLLYSKGTVDWDVLYALDHKWSDQELVYFVINKWAQQH